MKHLRLLKTVAVFACLALLLGCPGKNNPTGTGSLKVGVVAPFEGPNAHIGRMIMNSVKLYFDQNHTEGLNVSLIPIDTKSNPADTVAALQATVPDPQLIGLIAFY